MLTLTESGWLLNGQPTNVASWFPNSRTATINSDLSLPILLSIGNLLLLGNNFTVTGSRTETGITLSSVSNIRITDLNFNSFGSNMLFNSATSIVLNDVNITGGVNGADVFNSNLCTFVNCSFSGCEQLGINLTNCSNTAVISSSFTNNEMAGISGRNVTATQISGNQFINNGVGVAISNVSNNNGILENQFVNNQASVILAISPSFNDISRNECLNDVILAINLFQRATNNEVFDNEINASTNGIDIVDASNNAILNNDINAIQDGVINRDSNGTQIVENIISTIIGQGINVVSGNNLDIRDNIITSNPNVAPQNSEDNCPFNSLPPKIQSMLQ